MKMDFTIKIYKQLLESLIKQNYSFQTFEDFIQKPIIKSIVLRHDVDLLPQNSLRFAKIQADLGIKGTYYFRAVPESWDVNIIKEIASLGHEIGYHYECLTTCKGNIDISIKDFEKNLLELRKLAPVSTICMHGSPMSKFDSKDLWLNNNYKDFGIIAEPYFDVDFSKVTYLTDTGRRWDGEKVSVRDKVDTSLYLNIRSTENLISKVNKGELSNQIMFTFHPQRWNNFGIVWLKELILQNIKNLIKRILFVKR